MTLPTNEAEAQAMWSYLFLSDLPADTISRTLLLTVRTEAEVRDWAGNAGVDVTYIPDESTRNYARACKDVNGTNVTVLAILKES